MSRAFCELPLHCNYKGVFSHVNMKISRHQTPSTRLSFFLDSFTMLI